MLTAFVLGLSLQLFAGTCGDLRVVDGRVWTDITINGVATEALFDSGSEITVVDLGFAAQAIQGDAETVEARGTGAATVSAGLVQGVSIGAAGLELADSVIAVMDLSDISERLVGRPVPAILGREAFDASRLAIDFDAGQVCRMDRAAEPDGARRALVSRAGIMAFEIAIEGQTVLADFDTGNRGALLLDTTAAEAAGLLDGRAETLRSGGGIGGAVDRRILEARSVEVAGAVFDTVEAEIDPRESEAGSANIGLGLLTRFHLVVDFAESAIWLAPRQD
ncbi:pepsin/retropepsin-like aspartic protease family protein [Glycocaulis sp.]|uniref:pepsin/retropepsin-like aspartic protease family protein n=1 Tax=Glycocaulis sp. TaxID=1969725 RepID=UPI003F71AADA